jgi:hypothetical protein
MVHMTFFGKTAAQRGETGLKVPERIGRMGVASA